VAIVVPLLVVAAPGAGAGSAQRPRTDVNQRAIDGRGNNTRHPDWGQAGHPYRRVAEATYADGVAEPYGGPSPRAISNRVFNDTSQNLFSENGVTHWGFAWGQFIDHSIGERIGEGGEDAPLGYDSDDALERFANDFGAIPFTRTPAAPDTGSGDTPRQQINTIDSFIDASAVYGNSAERLEWLREGPVDGDLSNNGARLLLPDGQLPTVTERGDAEAAPSMQRDGRLRAAPERAVVAGDDRANENIALTGTQLLFAREHNRIVDALPDSLSEQHKFNIARRVVGAEQQYITYSEFLPSVGIRLDDYEGYDRRVDPTLSNEFAVVGYRAHSMIHGELEPAGDPADYTAEQLEEIEAAGVEVETEEDELAFVVPLAVAFFHPDLVEQIGLDPIMLGLGGESEYRNDEQMDDQLRSVLFQVPRPDVVDQSACLDGESMPECYQGVVDLGALDVQRGRDHGMPHYNDLRRAYGLPPKTSFTAITGEDTAEFPSDPEIDADDPLDDPDTLDFVELRDAAGNVIPPDSEEAETSAVSGTRRTTLAARLQALYGEVDEVDAFVGMLSERHIRGTEFGELQYVMWKDEFQRLRDGDRFFYGNDRRLDFIRLVYGIDYRRTLAEVIVDNTDLEADELEANVFRLPENQNVERPRDRSRAPTVWWRPWG
jgi:hypothetical protein